MVSRNWIRFGCAVLLIAFGLFPGTAGAQEQPPSHWDVLKEGVPIPSEKLRADLADVAGVFDVGGHAAGMGYVFICREDDPIIWFFDNGSVRQEQGNCIVEGSRLCFGADTEGQCMELRTMPGWHGIFLTFERDADALSADDIAFMKQAPAIRLGTLPIKADALLDASGLIDFGPVAFNLPSDADFVLRQGSGLPLGLAFGDKSHGGFRVNTEIVGWPNYYALPVKARSPGNGERDLANAQLEGWEKGYRNRDLGGYFGSTYKLLRYGAEKVEIDNGPCIRIREDIGVVQAKEGWKISPALTAYFRQACITPSGGVFLLVTTAINDPETDEAVAEFEATSLAILNSLRLGYARSE